MLIRHGKDDTWRTLGGRDYASEEELELLLEESPSLLPWGFSGDLAVARQVDLPTGTADLIGVGLNGEIVLVECKLDSNSEIRRHILGQVFAYASALWRMPLEEFSDRWRKRKGVSLVESARILASRSAAVWDEDGFRHTLSANLRDGRFRLLVAVNQITPELRGIIEYVNAHTIPELQVLALQLQHQLRNLRQVYLQDVGL